MTKADVVWRMGQVGGRGGRSSSDNRRGNLKHKRRGVVGSLALPVRPGGEWFDWLLSRLWRHSSPAQDHYEEALRSQAHGCARGNVYIDKQLNKQKIKISLMEITIGFMTIDKYDFMLLAFVEF